MGSEGQSVKAKGGFRSRFITLPVALLQFARTVHVVGRVLRLSRGTHGSPQSPQDFFSATCSSLRCQDFVLSRSQGEVRAARDSSSASAAG